MGALEISLDVRLVTDEADLKSALPGVGVFARWVRYAPLTAGAAENHLGADVAVVDARTILSAARSACRRLAIARRRNALEREGTLRFGDLILRPASYTASAPNREFDLTLYRVKLLHFLVRHAGRAFTRTRLMHEIWGRECSRRTIDVHVQRLRAKLGTEYESVVDTVRGVGYMAVDAPQPRRVLAGAPSTFPIAQYG